MKEVYVVTYQKDGKFLGVFSSKHLAEESLRFSYHNQGSVDRLPNGLWQTPDGLVEISPEPLYDKVNHL